jgi:hypothetical protein
MLDRRVALKGSIRAQRVAALALLVALAVLLRGYDAASTMRFTGDEARDLLQARLITERGVLPTLGPKIYEGQGNLGPAYAYLMALPLWGGGYDPAAAVWTIISFDAAAVLLMYAVAARLFGANGGMIAAFLYTVSFTHVFYARWCWHPSLVPFFTLLLIYAVLRSGQGGIGHLCLAAGAFSILLQLHLSTSLLAAPLAVALWWNRRVLTVRRSIACVVAFLVPALPLIAREWTSGFANARGMLGLGRVVASGNDAPYGPFLVEMAQVVADRAYWPFGKRTVLVDHFGWMEGLNAALCVLGLGVAAARLRQRRFDLAVVAAWALLPAFALVSWQGQRQQYYLLFWLPVLLLAVAALLEVAARGAVTRWIAAGVGAALVVVNTATLAAYFARVEGPRYDTFLAGPLWEKKSAVAAIVDDAGDAPYDLLIFSWHWSNHAPYVYLLANESNRPRETRMYERPYGSSDPGKLHFIDTSATFAPSTSAPAQRTYAISEPHAPEMFPEARRLDDAKQIGAYRLSDTRPADLMGFLPSE